MNKIRLFFLCIFFCLQSTAISEVLFSDAYAGDSATVGTLYIDTGEESNIAIDFQTGTAAFQIPDLDSLARQRANIENLQQNPQDKQTPQVLQVPQALQDSVIAEPYTFSQEWSQGVFDGNEYTLLTIWLEPSSGYYTYGHIKKEGVFPTELSYVSLESSMADLGTSFSEPRILYPKGILKVPPHLENLGKDSLASEIYEGHTPIFILFLADYIASAELARSGELLGRNLLSGEVRISLLACSVEHCIPLRTNIFVQEPENLPVSENMPWYDDFEILLNDSITLDINASIEIVGTSEKDLNSLSSDMLNTLDTQGMLDTQDGIANREFSPQSLSGSNTLSGLGIAILLGFLAGLILNMMPCVLPVVAIKIAALLSNMSNASDGEQGRRHFVRYNLFFALGIVLWFTLLALLLGLAGLTWGQLFQSKALVLGLTVFLFLLSLSLFHVFHLPMLDLQLKKGSGTNHAKQGANTPVEAVFTGFVATLLATPCSGPLLGGVLAYSLTQPLIIQILIFIAMGCGMASPYVLFALRPSLVRFLPKPGNWLLVLEKVLAFFLLGSSIYFLSILPDEWTLRVIILLFVISICAYAWGVWGSLRMAGVKKGVFAGFLLFIVVVSALFLFTDKEEKDFWIPYTQSTFEEFLGKELLVVVFTADWCPTCKVLEFTVLTQKNLQELENAYDAIFVKVDMTDYDETQQAFLRSLDSVSIPLLAVFPKGDASKRPIVLRDVYTKNQLYEAVKKASL